jgi:hypothetical protein
MPIDRSKPLPIHEPAHNMIARVAELKKLRDNPFVPMVQLMNAAHDDLSAMLDILGEIRAGDAEKLQYAIRWLETTNINQVCIDMLKRYQAMAAKMEENK